MTASLLIEYFDNLLIAPENVEQLNHAILELAIRGKLTHREESDESAKELLRRIRGEREKLTHDGGLKKTKESLVIKEDNQLYDLPDDWVWCRINDIGAAINNAIVDGPFGSNLVLSDYDDFGEYPVITISNIDNGFDLTKLRKINQKKFEELKRSAVNPGDLLVAKIGSSWGKVGIYPLNMPVGIIPANLLKITVNSNLSKDYVRYFLQSKTQRKQLEKLVKFTAQPAFNVTAFKQLLFPLPPLAEQQRIVARVEELFAQTHALAKELAHSQIELDGLNQSALSHLLASETPEEFNQHWHFIAEHFDLLIQSPEHVAPLRQSILELAVRGKLTRREAADEPAKELLKQISEKEDKSLLPIKEDEKPYELPVGWEWARFENIANIATNSVQPDDFQDLPHVAPNNIEKGTGRLLGYKTVAEDEVRSINHRFFPGQLLYSKIRPNLSKAIIVNFEGLCSADMYPLDVFIDPRYLLRFILSSVFLEMVTKNDTRVAMPKVNQNELNKVLIAVPPLAEQERIVKRVEQLLSLCDTLEGRLQSAEEERGRLVAAVMSTVGG